MKVMNGMKIMKIMRIMKDCGVTVTRLDVSTFVVDLADLLLTYLKLGIFSGRSFAFSFHLVILLLKVRTLSTLLS